MNGITYALSATRREDDRLITGRGQYADDVRHSGALRAAFVRSPYAAAKILSIDVAGALAMPGVTAILTAGDLDDDGVKDYSTPAKIAHVDGSFSTETPRSLLARDRVRFLAEPVAMVIATSDAIAQDAAELVVVEYEEIPAVVDPFAAAEPDAPRIWEDRSGNLAFHWRRGNAEAVAAALASAHHVTRLKSRVSRVAAMPMEPRSALAYMDEQGRPVIRISHQSPHILRNMLCAQFGLERHQLRVIAGDVGGSFGMKSGLLREEALVFWAARRLQKAVRWAAGRSEAFLSDEQARDVHVESELGLDAYGRFTALRVRYDVNVGAYMSGRSSAPIGNFGGIAGVYTTPAIVGEAVGWFTNTQPTSPYRGAGRPDATFVIERIIDVAAEELGIDPAELRRRNLIPPEAMPYQTPFVFRYDCGEFERNMDRALELIGYAGFPERREMSRKHGRLRGIGIANPIEVAAGPYARPGTDYATVKAHPDGTVTLFSGAMSVGQGLDTALSTLVSQRLGLPLERIRFVQGDTDLLANGKGNGGSAALTLCGSAIQIGVDQLLEKAIVIASDELEASSLDLEYSEGVFRIVGSDRRMSLAEIAAIVEAQSEQDSPGLAGSGQYTLEQPTFPNGCHICEIEIDPDTGLIEVLNYVSVEDVGRVLNPMLVEGQIHGGVAQGIGQALLEEVRFGDDGQLLTGSFMDYAMPRASDLSNIQSENLETPTALNPLGVKGVGEAGTVGGLAAAMNAVCNALAQVGVKHIDMPATPLRVWEAIQQARQE